ncbi:Nucleotide-binding universal stress protein, UspA family [Haloplanus vescus]|mgnify:CR=1 FL=1|uniref:Nucleotide-binding universal stress protein, UspA family n=1 Tax=Haloplanus vescus TaxID=555874 RepID=A0A1H3X8X2_9EURY|nr:universal stress protein [Haloplanus vescus]SDZ95713.1 Nucleotide-binding universal stress protein, UspA family [Haloplanus vescus]
MSESLSPSLVLVPVDGSEESLTAVEYATTIADEYDAAVHALYVVSEDVARAIDSGAVDDESVAADTEAFMQAVTDRVDEAGVPLSTSMAYGFSTRQLSRHPGSVVLDTAEELGADFVVVPRESLSGDADEVLAKAAEYVLLYATQPILSV